MAYKSRLPLCGALFLWAAAVALKASVESALVPLDNEDTENATEVEHDEGVVRVDRLWSNIEDKLEAIYSTIWDSQLLENDTMKISDFSDGLVSSLVITILSELGDKTFFITAILAARHSRYIVYCGAMSALILMTLAATGLGYAAQFVPRYVIHYTSICLFILFGLHMLYEGVQKCRKKSSQTAEDIKDVSAHCLYNLDIFIYFDQHALTEVAEYLTNVQFTIYTSSACVTQFSIVFHWT